MNSKTFEVLHGTGLKKFELAFKLHSNDLINKFTFVFCFYAVSTGLNPVD